MFYCIGIAYKFIKCVSAKNECCVFVCHANLLNKLGCKFVRRYVMQRSVVLLT